MERKRRKDKYLLRITNTASLQVHDKPGHTLTLTEMEGEPVELTPGVAGEFVSRRSENCTPESLRKAICARTFSAILETICRSLKNLPPLIVSVTWAFSSSSLSPQPVAAIKALEIYVLVASPIPVLETSRTSALFDLAAMADLKPAPPPPITRTPQERVFTSLISFTSFLPDLYWFL